MRLNLAFYLHINIHMGSSVRLTGLGTVAGEKWKFLARWVDFKKSFVRLWRGKKTTFRDFVARLAAARPKKLAPLAKKLMRSTWGKSTSWHVSSFSGVFKWEWETKLHLFVYTFPLLFPFRLVGGESDDVKRFLIMSWSDSHSPL